MKDSFLNDFLLRRDEKFTTATIERSFRFADSWLADSHFANAR